MDKKIGRALGASVVLCVIGVLLSLRLGAVNLSLEQLWEAIRSGPNDTSGYIFWYSRLPRTCACLLAGAALACSGCILQSVLGNKLASPNIIGVNAGAGLAVTLCCAAGVLSGWVISLAAFGGALFTVFTVVGVARHIGASRTTVILSGVAMNSILGAFRDAVTILVPDAAMLSGEFRMGGFSSVVAVRLIPAGILIVLSLLIVLTLCNELDVLALGEETACSLGMSVKTMRTVFLLLAALLAGAAVSFAGLLGFVGLLIPHIARKLSGGESRYLIPLSILLGAGFVTISDLISRLIFAPYELYVGILMSVIGGPFFLFLLLERKRGHRNA
ncbi:MAG: iron ABC transporter permease [Oscillospiraceae bacterium]|nr:iron ABC transporter permease [Oscillospiraceae bacterium]